MLRRTELADGLVLEQCTSALGVLLVIFEARPDALPQVVALAVRSGNGVILKGGKEAVHSNRALFDVRGAPRPLSNSARRLPLTTPRPPCVFLYQVSTAALEPDVPRALVGLVEARATIDALLALDDVIDLVIPRGSNALVRYIQEHTRIPVMGHAEGVCHVYVDRAVDLARAIPVILDAKTDYPSACNAMETLLLHRDLVRPSSPVLKPGTGRRSPHTAAAPLTGRRRARGLHPGRPARRLRHPLRRARRVLPSPGVFSAQERAWACLPTRACRVSAPLTAPPCPCTAARCA